MTPFQAGRQPWDWLSLVLERKDVVWLDQELLSRGLR